MTSPRKGKEWPKIIENHDLVSQKDCVLLIKVTLLTSTTCRILEKRECIVDPNKNKADQKKRF